MQLDRDVQPGGRERRGLPCRLRGGSAGFATVPGLVSKAWIADEGTKTYGGVHTFADRASMDAYVAGNLVRSIGEDPTVVHLSTRVFEVLDEAGRITHVATR